MKKLLLLTILLSRVAISFSQTSLEWFDIEKKIIERVDLQNGNYEIEFPNSLNSIKSAQKLKFIGIKQEDILANFVVNVFNLSSKKLLTIPGTGQVYELDVNKQSFKRLDKTFYRGYNFKAIQFIQNDTLFSLGGTGFWQYHNILSYYDPNFSEWEAIDTYGKRPEGIYLNSSGTNFGKVFAIDKLRELDNKDLKKKSQIFELDIKSKTWKNLGELNIPMLTENEINGSDFQWSSNHLFFLHSKEPVFADVLNNKVYQYNASRNGILSNKGQIFISKGWVYTFRNDQKKYTLDSISYSELIRNSKYLGQLYFVEETTSKINSMYIFIILIIVLIGFYLVYQKNKKLKKGNIEISKVPIPKYLDKFLEEYKINGSDYLLTTDELSKIIECDSMAFDTQRQYRSKFISSVNTFALDTFGFTDAIFRINHDSDKRFIHYGIKMELFALIDTILV